MIPPLMPCGHCYYCIHYPESANKCLTPVYYGRYLGFDKAPHLWGGWAEYVYVDLDMLPGTKIYKLPDDMSLRLGALSEPLTSCIRAFNRATRAGGFKWGDTVVIQGSGPIGILAVAAAQEMGAGRVICVGAPEDAAAAAGAQVRRRGDGRTSRSCKIAGRAHQGGARHRRRLRRRPRDGLLGPSDRRPRRHRDAARRRHLCRDGPVHRCRLDRRRHGIASAPRTSTCSAPGALPATTCRSASTCSIARATNIPGWRCRRSIRSPRRASRQAVADAMAMKTVKSTIVPWPELVE